MPIRFPKTKSRRGVTEALALLASLIVVAALVSALPALGSSQRRSPRQKQAFPTSAQVARARHFARSRQGSVSFTVSDSHGRRYDLDGYRQFISASVVKAMLMTCFLNTKTLDHQQLTATDRSELRAMITVSDNDAANWVYNQVGDAHLVFLAHRLGMRHFSVAGYWGYAQVTTNDQALLMSKLDRAVYRPYRAYARSLLSSVVSWESWGIPQVAHPLGWKVFFKGGWRGTVRGQLVHQVARLERRNEVIVICVMTDGDPSQSYGEETIAGIARNLLRSHR
jgi:hypothetical protein